MIQKCSQHLDNVLIQSHEPWFIQRHKMFEQYNGETREKELDFYERQQIDKFIRKNNEKRCDNLVSPTDIQNASKQKSVPTTNIADDDERKRIKRAKKLQKTLGITFEEALKVDAITVNKGLQSKTKIDEDELKFSKGYYNIVKNSKPFLQSLDDKKRVIVPMPKRNEDIESEQD